MKKLIGILLAVYVSSVWAGNYSFLNYSPIRYLTTEDAEIYKAAEMKALNTTKDGQKVAWQNPHTGASGYLIPVKTEQLNGQTCRELKKIGRASCRERV